MINLFSIHKFFADAFTFYSGPSGGGSSTSYTSNVPKGMEGDAKNLFNMMQQQLLNIDENGNIVGFKPYVPYSANPADYVAGFSPMQEQSFRGAANLSVPGQYGQATDLASAAGMGGINSAQQAYNYGQLGSQYGAQGAGYGDISAQIGQMGLQAQQTGQGITNQSQNLAAQQAAAGQNYAGMATDPNAVQAYMSPYQQAVTQQAIDAAYRNADIQKTGRQAAAAKASAFGGSRQAIENAEADRALNERIQAIQATGDQAAYDKAMQSMQYGTSLGLQGLGGAQSGLGTALQGGQLGLSGIGTALQGLQGGMQGSGIGIQGAQAGLQGVSGAQAGYGLANQAGSNLANIGTQQNQAAQSILDQQNRFGAQQQQQQQNITNQAIQNYAMAQENPNIIAQNLSNMIRGTQGQGSSTTNYQAAPSALGTAASLGTAALGARAAGVFAEGGIVKLAQGGAIKGYADGGVTGIDNVEKIAGKLSIPQLQQALQNKTVPEYVGIPLLQMKTQEAQAAQAAMQQQGGQAPTIKDQIMQQAQQAEGMQGIEGLPSNLPTEEMAEGGIVAFADNRDQPVRVGMPGSSDYMQLTPEQFNNLTPAEKVNYIRQYGSPPSAAAGRNPNVIKSIFGGEANPSDPSYAQRLQGLLGAGPGENVFQNLGRAVSAETQSPAYGVLAAAKPAAQAAKPKAALAQPEAAAPLTAERIQMPELPSLGGMGPGRTPKFDFKPEEYDTSAQQAILARQKNPETGKFYTEDELTAKEEAKRTKAGITDIYTPERERLEKEIGGLEGKKKEAWGLALMQGAFDSLAKGDPNAARSMGLIGSGTMKAITPALKEIKESEKDMRKQQFNLAGLQQQYKQAVLSGNQAAIDKYQAKLDTVETNLEAARNKNVEARNSVGLVAEKAEYDYTKDMGLTAMRESGANARANATNQLYYAGLKGGTGSPKGSFTADQINQMYEDFGPQADQILATETAKYGKAQLKDPTVVAAINARREQIIQELINKRMNQVGGLRSGVGSNTIDYSALQSLYPK